MLAPPTCQQAEFKIITGDCRTVLKTILSDQVHCVVTSPPYWGLRNYGIAAQIGLEPSPQAYVKELVEVFREVRRVLRPDGTLWLNMGDSYVAGGRGGGGLFAADRPGWEGMPMEFGKKCGIPGLKSKDLVGIPWHVAFALQEDGWYLRQDIIWAKPNPMPESIRDRCTKSHEYLFLLAKFEQYYFNQEAIKEPAVSTGRATKMPDGWDTGAGGHGSFHRQGREKGKTAVGRASGNVTPKYTTEYDQSETEEHRTKAGLLKISDRAYETRIKRSVWTIATKPFKEAHFATFPPALVEPCVLAGCPPGGIVLDPFAGAGTTGLVANGLGRHFVGVELNPEYAAMAERRLRGAQAPEGLDNPNRSD